MQTQIKDNKNNLDKSPERVKCMFSSIAPWYDFLNHFLSLGIDCYWRRRVVNLIFSELQESGGIDSILDVCCGTGDLIREFIKRSKSNCEITGIDFSEKMIELACKKLPKISDKLIVGDATELPFKSENFRVVSCAFGLRNISEMERGLEEMIRVCKLDGIVAILEFSMPRNYFVRCLYKFYFADILPLVGNFFAGARTNAYNYLPQSVLNFDTPQSISSRMQRLGLDDIKIVPMTFGIVNLIYGKKI
ncbi:MAG: bifunctional demethylmenaquinone methyltransferase/2-methoxy-6-polyprenyl-1,4-benzoquinol methylase UbiE [Planctomycetaceae bacterium]|jgi:demethylmenaquinone methyltransferase/2-methoxy-6-polyprenyl-1,4-benzoquinol methylase|nr:bifunctional demethylmenaquinone methyltransferase/2-methoxy-6-polyprenyl-1,4-benzoquinol methylase UbiE [Planctomycetaceae bacterium]